MASTATSPSVHIEAVQSVMPINITDPRPTRHVLLTDVPAGSGIFQKRLHAVLFYQKSTEEDSGWITAGWIRESLGKALTEQPMLGGRLQRRGKDGGGELEIVANDSGIRLVEAKVSMDLLEFVELTKGKEDAEGELVFWKEIDQEDPMFSPLFYVQVTNFQCGGYSIGISCSLLLADLLVVRNFLKRWAKIHNNILSQNQAPTMPIFFLPNLKNNSSPSSSYRIFSSIKSHGQKALIFKIGAPEHEVKSEHNLYKTIASKCIEEMERKLEIKTASNVLLFVKKSEEIMTVESCEKHELVSSRLSLGSTELCCGSWDDMGAKEVFFGGNKPWCVSHWIGSGFYGLVMAIFPCIDEEEEGMCKMNIVVTIPNEKEA